MSLQFSATIPGFSATGRLGFFDVTAKDIINPSTGIGSNFTGTLSLGMNGPSAPADGYLTLGDLDSGLGFGDVVQAALSAQAHVALQLTAGIFSSGTTSFDLAAAMPRIGTEFHLDWDFSPSTDDFDGSAPSVSFDDVELYLGDFLSNILGNVLGEIDSVTAPLQPIIDILDTPLPVISQLAGRDFTMLDLVALFADDDDIGYIQAVADVISLAQDLGDLGSLSSLAIPVGSFSLGGVSDLRTLSSLGDAVPVDESMDFSNLGGAEEEAGGAPDLSSRACQTSAAAGSISRSSTIPRRSSTCCWVRTSRSSPTRCPTWTSGSDSANISRSSAPSRRARGLARREDPPGVRLRYPGIA